MNVNAAGSAPGLSAPPASPPPGLSAAPALNPLPPSPTQPADRSVSVLLELSNPAIQAAIHVPVDHAAAETLIHHAAQAVEHNDLPRALHIVTELLTRQPEADLHALRDPALAPIHNNIRELVGHLTAEAKIDAHRTLAIASPLAAAIRTAPEAPAVLTLANQFIETGQYINYVRAAQLGRLVISWSQAQKNERRDHAEQTVARMVDGVTKLWRRAPLLALLIAWLVLGVILVPLAADYWAIGFLALIGLQFVLTIRNATIRNRPRWR